MKILLVDDDELMLQAMNHHLSHEGYEIVTVNDASKAIDVLQKEKIDLIICDIMMPNLSGLGFLSLLKNFYFDKIPVILISSLDKGDVVTNSLGLGAAYFLPKPIDLNVLSQRVKDVFNKEKV